MQNRTLIIVIAVLLVSNLVLLGAYFFGKQEKKPSENRADRTPAGFMTRELGLDSTQAQQFRELWDTVSAKNKIIFDSLRTNREALYSLLKQEPQPDSMIRVLAGKVGEFEKQITLNNYSHFRKVRAICNETQQIKLDSVITRMAKRGKRR